MKLLIADDHALFRDIISHYILDAEPDADIHMCKNVGEIHAKLKEGAASYDLVIMDWMMPGVDGINTFRDIINTYPDTPLAIISGVVEQKHISDIMDLGAAGYFPKTMSGASLMSAIKLVLTGERFCPVLAGEQSLQPSYYGARPKHLSDATERYDMNSEGINLTRRERDVLAFLLKGASNKEIANALGLQIVTIKLHVRGICRKLKAQNRTQAALRARELNLCEEKLA